MGWKEEGRGDYKRKGKGGEGKRREDRINLSGVCTVSHGTVPHKTQPTLHRGRIEGGRDRDKGRGKGGEGR